MEDDVEKRDVSTGGNGREAASERVIPGRRIIGTAEEGYVYKRQAAHGCFNDPYVQGFFPAYLIIEVAGQSEAAVEANGTACGGHLMEAYVRPTLEVILVESPQHLRRQTDAESGLALIRL